MTDNTHPHDPTEKNYSGTVAALLNAKEWFNNGDCCGQVDASQ